MTKDGQRKIYLLGLSSLDNFAGFLSHASHCIEETKPLFLSPDMMIPKYHEVVLMSMVSC
jgi:hypothetical protein